MDNNSKTRAETLTEVNFLTKKLIDNNVHCLDVYFNYLISRADCTEVCIATGYWDLPGTKIVFENLKTFIKKGGKLRLLIGEEPMLRSYQLKNDINHNSYKFPDFYMKRDYEMLDSEYIPIAEFLLRHCKAEDENSPIQIAVYGQKDQSNKKFLHSKCYIFRADDSKGIIGSSNFTKAGLTDNAELNYYDPDSNFVEANPTNKHTTQIGHVAWFEEKWQQSEPWTGRFINEILRKSPVGRGAIENIKEKEQLVKPFDAYIKFLQMQYGEIFDDESIKAVSDFIPDGINKYDYQIEAVNTAYSIMKAHNGCLLADVVGLGKTIVGILVVLRFLYDKNITLNKKVLIITPPAIKPAWEDTLDLFAKKWDIKDNITFITTGMINKMMDADEENLEEQEAISDIDDIIENNDEENTEESNKKGAGALSYTIDTSNIRNDYGLILIDESHKFRNTGTQMYKAIDEMIGDSKQKPLMLLLSATPQNNSPNDLRNQIALFQRSDNFTTLDIEGGKLAAFFIAKQKEFLKARKETDTNKAKEIINSLSNDIREKVLNHLMVRRTRTDIKTHYKDDAEKLSFPSIDGPKQIEYELGEDLAKLFNDTMDIIAPYDPKTKEIKPTDRSLGYFRYRAIEHFKSDEHRNIYEKNNMTVNKTANQLAHMMQMLLVKRLESSKSAFVESLNNLRRYTQNIIDMFDEKTVFVCPTIDVNKELDLTFQQIKHGTSYNRQDAFNAIRKKIKQKGEPNREFEASDFTPDYLIALKKDRDKIDALFSRWTAITKDPKLDAFIRNLHRNIFPQINDEDKSEKRKLVIFAEAIATIKELSEKIEGQTDYKVLTITSKNRKEMKQTIIDNFDANATNKKDDYDIIISSDVLAEGVNLHRSNIVINYDTPWNSTKLLQRIGRVNRIGTKADTIYVYNFMPTSQSNDLIKLIEITFSKIQSFHSMFGGDDKVYTQDEEVSVFDWGKSQIEQIIDGPESQEEPYKTILREFKSNNPDEYNRIKKLELPIITAKLGDEDQTLTLMKSKTNSLLIATDDKEAKILDNAIDMIDKIKCEANTNAESKPTKLDERHTKAKDAFIKQLDRMITAGDNHKNTGKAKEKLRNILKKIEDTQAKDAIAKIADAVKLGNKDVINKVIKININDKIEDIEKTIINMAKKIQDDQLQKDLNAKVIISISNVKK